MSSTTGTDRCGRKRSSASRLVTWSATTTSAATPRNRKPRSGNLRAFGGWTWIDGTVSVIASRRRVGRAFDSHGDGQPVDLVFAGMPAIAGRQAGLELRRQRLATDVRGVLLERVGRAIRGRVAHVDAVRDFEAGLLARVLD